MSRLTDTIKNKNRVERAQHVRRKEEIASLRVNSAFKARLYDELKKVNMLLESDEVSAVMITIPDVFLAKFGEALYSEDLVEYDIQQVEGEPNKFYIKHKFIQL